MGTLVPAAELKDVLMHILEEEPKPCPTAAPLFLDYSSLVSASPPLHVILCCPLLLPPSIFPSIGVFSNESFLQTSGQSIGVSASASVLAMNIQE